MMTQAQLAKLNSLDAIISQAKMARKRVGTAGGNRYIRDHVAGIRRQLELLEAAMLEHPQADVLIEHGRQQLALDAPLAWVRENPGAQRDEGSYYKSACGRFSISPRFRHTIYPDSYSLRDNVAKTDCVYDTIRDCKERAARLHGKA